MSKYTPWFPGAVKPVRAGVYERRYAMSGVVHCKWDGEKWFAGSLIGPCEAEATTFQALNQKLPWRGLAEKPA